MSRELPDRPNLEHLRKEAKALAASTNVALHQAQHQLARDYGFKSWNAMRAEIEARMLSFEAAVDEFVRSATGGARGRAERLLALHPGIRSASLQTALVLGDVDRVETHLSRKTDLAVAPGGTQNWPPLLYVCHTCL